MSAFYQNYYVLALKHADEAVYVKDEVGFTHKRAAAHHFTPIQAVTFKEKYMYGDVLIVSDLLESESITVYEANTVHNYTTRRNHRTERCAVCGEQLKTGTGYRRRYLGTHKFQNDGFVCQKCLEKSVRAHLVYYLNEAGYWSAIRPTFQDLIPVDVVLEIFYNCQDRRFYPEMGPKGR